jgi:DNA invertase Pin-like site-specific DNA recombinase
MDVGIYARVSSRDRGQDFTNQLLALREFCLKQGWTIYREYVDQISGDGRDRPAFRQMFQDASQRKFDVLLFWSLDRLSREGCLRLYSTCRGSRAMASLGAHSLSNTSIQLAYSERP